MQFHETGIPPSVQRQYGLSIRTVATASGGFSGATVFRATTDDGRELAIRRTPTTNALLLKRLMALYELLSSVSQLGCRIVAVPMLTASSSDRLVTPWLHDREDIWQVEPWMPGVAREQREITTSHVTAGLTALDRFHKLAAESLRKISPSEWFQNTVGFSPGMQRRHGIVCELQNGTLITLSRKLNSDPDSRMRQLAARLRECLQTWLPWLLSEFTALATQPFSLQPVLRDVWRAHVLFTECDVTGLIDLSAAATDHVTLDITRLLRSWYGADAVRIRNSIEEYDSLRKLDADERRLLQAFDAATVLLSPVTWLRRRSESEALSEPSDHIIGRLTELTEVAVNFRPLFE